MSYGWQATRRVPTVAPKERRWALTLSSPELRLAGHAKVSVTSHVADFNPRRSRTLKNLPPFNYRLTGIRDIWLQVSPASVLLRPPHGSQNHRLRSAKHRYSTPVLHGADFEPAGAPRRAQRRVRAQHGQALPVGCRRRDKVLRRTPSRRVRKVPEVGLRVRVRQASSSIASSSAHIRDRSVLDHARAILRTGYPERRTLSRRGRVIK